MSLLGLLTFGVVSGQEKELVITEILGFSDYYKMGSWTPLSVLLQNRGKTVDGWLEVILTSGSEFKGNIRETVYRKKIVLPTGSQKLFSFSLPIDSPVFPLQINIWHNESLVGSKSVSVKDQFTDKQLVLLLDDSLTARLFSFLPEQYLGIHSSPIYLPEHWISYQGVAAIVSDVDSILDLRSQQFQAMKEWVTSGGQLYLTGRFDPGTLKESKIKQLVSEGMLMWTGSQTTANFETTGQRDQWRPRKSLLTYSDPGLDETGLQTILVNNLPNRGVDFFIVLSGSLVGLILLFYIKKDLVKKSESFKRQIIRVMLILGMFTVLASACYLKQKSAYSPFISGFTLIDKKMNDSRVWVDHQLGFFSLFSGSYSFDRESDHATVSLGKSELSSHVQGADLVIEEAEEKIRITVNQANWSHRFLKFGMVDHLDIKGNLVLKKESLLVNLNNSSLYTLTDIDLVFEGKHIKLGEIEPGSVIRKSFKRTEMQATRTSPSNNGVAEQLVRTIQYRFNEKKEPVLSGIIRGYPLPISFGKNEVSPYDHKTILIWKLNLES